MTGHHRPLRGLAPLTLTLAQQQLVLNTTSASTHPNDSYTTAAHIPQLLLLTPPTPSLCYRIQLLPVLTESVHVLKTRLATATLVPSPAPPGMVLFVMQVCMLIMQGQPLLHSSLFIITGQTGLGGSMCRRGATNWNKNMM